MCNSKFPQRFDWATHNSLKTTFAIARTMWPKGQIRSKFGEVFHLATTNPGQEPINKSKNCIAVSSWLRDHWYKCKKRLWAMLGQLFAEFQSSWKAANHSHEHEEGHAGIMALPNDRSISPKELQSTLPQVVCGPHQLLHVLLRLLLLVREHCSKVWESFCPHLETLIPPFFCQPPILWLA